MNNVSVSNTKVNLTVSKDVLNTKKELLKMSDIDKLKYVDQLVISYPKMEEILEKIEECQYSSLHSREPSCLSILGPPRAGKSTIIEQHMSKYPDKDLAEGKIKNIFYCRVPCPAYIGSLVTTLLYTLGDPFYKKRVSISENTQRLYKLLEKCDVKLILLDEVQHLVDRNRKTLILDSSDWFKNLISDTGIPVAFVGLPESKKIFLENEQLGGRVLNHFEIKPFNFEDKTFRIIVHLIDQALPLRGFSGLAEPDTWKRIYLATGGLLGYVKALIKECVRIALIQRSDKITMPILAKAFESKLLHIFQQNPFLPGFDIDQALEKKYYTNYDFSK